MKALLKKTRKWVDIDTKFMFDNQYNTVDTPTGKGKRIFDEEIVRLYEDERIPRLNEYHSVYNGKVFNTEEEFKDYCAENRRKYETNEACHDCFYCKKRRINETKTTSKEKINGKIKETVVEEYELEPYCDYKYDDKCELLAPERYGVVHPWQNAYFVKHPYGHIFDSQEEELDILVKGCWRIKVESSSFVLYNSKYSFRGDFKVTYNTYEPSVSNVTFETIGFPNTKTFDKVCYMFKDKINIYIKRICDFNSKVMSSWMYRQPDGTMLDEVEIDGKMIKRPEPILKEEYQVRWLLKDLKIDLSMLDCYREYEEREGYDEETQDNYIKSILENPGLMRIFIDEIRNLTKWN